MPQPTRLERFSIAKLEEKRHARSMQSAHDLLPLKRAVGSMALPTKVSAAEGASNQRVQAC